MDQTPTIDAREPASISDPALRSALRTTFNNADVGFAVADDRVFLDFSRLGHTIGTRTRTFLPTSAGLLLHLSSVDHVCAVMPSSLAGQRALASSGVLAALIWHDADLVMQESGKGDFLDSLLEFDQLPHLLGSPSWTHDFTPTSAEIRGAVISPTRPPSTGDAQEIMTISISHDNVLALVNPHRSRNENIVAEANMILRPWLYRTAQSRRNVDETKLRQVLSVLDEAVENVIQHAFVGRGDWRSLVTIEKFSSEGQEKLKLQVLDSGVGIPASLAGLHNPDLLTDEQAKAVVRHAVGADVRDTPLWRGARGRGLPRMVDIAEDLGGELTVQTSGPHETQILITSSDGFVQEPIVDRIPVQGTIVTLTVPTPSLAPPTPT